MRRPSRLPRDSADAERQRYDGLPRSRPHGSEGLGVEAAEEEVRVPTEAEGSRVAWSGPPSRSLLPLSYSTTPPRSPGSVALLGTGVSIRDRQSSLFSSPIGGELGTGLLGRSVTSFNRSPTRSPALLRQSPGAGFFTASLPAPSTASTQQSGWRPVLPPRGGSAPSLESVIPFPPTTEMDAGDSARGPSHYRHSRSSSFPSPVELVALVPPEAWVEGAGPVAPTYRTRDVVAVLCLMNAVLAYLFAWMTHAQHTSFAQVMVKRGWKDGEKAQAMFLAGVYYTVLFVVLYMDSVWYMARLLGAAGVRAVRGALTACGHCGGWCVARLCCRGYSRYAPVPTGTGSGGPRLERWPLPARAPMPRSEAACRIVRRRPGSAATSPTSPTGRTQGRFSAVLTGAAGFARWIVGGPRRGTAGAPERSSPEGRRSLA